MSRQAYLVPDRERVIDGPILQAIHARMAENFERGNV